jgi:DNA-binding NarL/FixJ family response regulator
MTYQKVVLAGPIPLFLEGLRLIIRGHSKDVSMHPDIEMMPGDEEMLIRALRVRPPNLVILDARSSTWNLGSVVRRLTKLLPDLNIIALTSDEESLPPVHLARRVRVLKPTTAVGEFLQLLSESAAFGGYDCDDPDVEETDGEMKYGNLSHSVMLTTRQIDVLRLLATGMPVKVIANELGISPRTVEFHKYRLMRTLEISSMAELVRYVIEAGFWKEPELPPEIPSLRAIAQPA